MRARQIQAFFGKDGPQKLIFFHQVEELEVSPGEFQASKSAQKGLFLTDGEHQRARGRLNPKCMDCCFLGAAVHLLLLCRAVSHVTEVRAGFQTFPILVSAATLYIRTLPPARCCVSPQSLAPLLPRSCPRPRPSARSACGPQLLSDRQT